MSVGRLSWPLQLLAAHLKDQCKTTGLLLNFLNIEDNGFLCNHCYKPNSFSQNAYVEVQASSIWNGNPIWR